MTFFVRGTRGEDATTVIRLRADTAVAKARELARTGWRVFIDSPDGARNYPGDFDSLLSGLRDDSALGLRQTESDLDVAV
jgi:hypothetical protein